MDLRLPLEQSSQACGPFDGAPVATVGVHILRGAPDEEGTSLREGIETSEFHIAAVEQVKRSSFQEQLVQNVDVVNLASRHIKIGRNAILQVQREIYE